MRRLAFSTNAFKRCSLQSAIQSIAEAGYSGVEILADIPHAYPHQFDTHQRARLREHIRSAGLSIANLNAFTMFAHGDTYHPSWIEADRGKRIEFTLKAVKLAEDIGAGCLSTEPGGPLRGERNEAVELFADGLRQVLPAAESAGVKILVEPEPGLLIESSEQMSQFLEMVESPALGVNFDIGHFHCVGERPADAFRKLRPWVHHVHVEDIAGRRHFHLIPGQGEIDFGEFFASADELGYRGFFTVELYTYEESPVEACKRAIEHLSRWLS